MQKLVYFRTLSNQFFCTSRQTQHTEIAYFHF